MDGSVISPSLAAEMIAVRHRIHAHPELGHEEFATSDLVASYLVEWGYQVHRGLGHTGMVGQLRVGDGAARLGIRADMDALPIQETTDLPYQSVVAGKMHACGHDGHTTILLAAARHLAQTRRFNGTLNLIFQPAEESLCGARKMLEDGLFQRFPCDAVFGLHNMPGLPAGQLAFRAGPTTASSDTVIVDVIGRGGHGAMPQLAIDPVVVCAHIVLALQTIVSREVPPLQTAVITVGAIHAGEAPNVIPERAQMRLSVRALHPGVRDLLERRISEVIHAQAAVYGATARIDYQRVCPVLVNHSEMTAFAQQVALDWLGAERTIELHEAFTGSEDFAFMLEQCPGSYLLLGNGVGEGGCQIHNPGYDFNDEVLPIGASYWVRLAESFLS